MNIYALISISVFYLIGGILWMRVVSGAEIVAEAEIKPRRKAFAVADLPFGAMIEIEFDAVKQG